MKDKKKASDLEALEQLIKKARKEIKGPDLDPKLLAKKQKKVKKILHKMEVRHYSYPLLSPGLILGWVR